MENEEIEERVLLELWRYELYMLYKKKYTNFLIVEDCMKDLEKKYPFEEWKIKFYKINE
jgi:hypothetical protein